MKIEMFQKIRLKDGKVGRVIEIFKDGEAYMIDIMTEDGEYEQETIYPEGIQSIIMEIDKAFVAAI